MTALPIFLVCAPLPSRRHPGACKESRNPDAQGFEGRRVGVNRGYTVMDGRVGARRSAGGIWRRSFQDHLGARRATSMSNIVNAGQCGADRAVGEGDEPTCWPPANSSPPSASRSDHPDVHAFDSACVGSGARTRCEARAITRSSTSDRGAGRCCWRRDPGPGGRYFRCLRADPSGFILKN